jgi:hypothetical protein
MKASNLTPDHDAVRRLVTAIPCHQASLAALAAHERGRVLLAHCPALAVLIVLSGAKLPGEARVLHWQKLAALPWREILAHVGLPARTKVLRILSKLSPEHCHVQTVRKLSKVLAASNHPSFHLLPHLPRLTRDSVSLLQLDPSPSLVSPELLRASTESDCDVETITWLVTGIQALLLQLGHLGAWPYTGMGVERLKLIEGELFAELHPDPVAFPNPPCAGRTGEIEPIRDLFALAREAEEQGNHSFVALLSEVLLGEAFVYAVHHPERATLALRRTDAFAAWEICDLRAPGNAAPMPATMSSVQAWFQAEQNAVPRN